MSGSHHGKLSYISLSLLEGGEDSSSCTIKLHVGIRSAAGELHRRLTRGGADATKSTANGVLGAISTTPG